MHRTDPIRRRRRIRGAAALSVAALMLTVAPSAATTAADRLAGTSAPVSTSHSESKPTVVLVHGAFADASGWNDVIARLQQRGYTVVAPPNPLRGLTGDAEYLRAFLSSIEGPIVLVGHSYGGAVLTNAATGNPAVEALVYIAAYALDEGESVAQANELGGGHSEVLDHILTRPFPGAPENEADVYVRPESFRHIFAQDLPRKQTAVMAATQRPGTFAALITPSGPPAWETVPTWYLVASDDNLIPPPAQRAMARRAGARTTAVHSSHVAMMSHPGRVAGLIVKADNHT